jgi:gliding-associated putative ABC transporter substrate-binding component GldG
MMLRKRFEIISTIILVAVFIFAAMNAIRFFFRIDITENRIYTISKVSKQLFTEIPEHVQITYFRSKKLDRLSSSPRQIEDLLYEYAAHSRGKISLKMVDPAAEAMEQDAQTYGVVPQQVEVVERNERSVALIYSGIVIEYLDRFETIPLVVRTDTLEYELTTKIRSLVQNETRNLGIIVGDSNRRIDRDYSMLYSGMQENFEVQPIQLGEPIPEDLAALFVLGNKDISRENLKQIDTYIMQGGSVCFFAESVYIDLQANLQAFQIEDTPLIEMLKTYGVEVGGSIVLDKYSRDFRVPTNFLGNVAWQIIGKYPEWIMILEENVAKNNPVTARFGGLDLLWANPLYIATPEEVTGEELIKTSEEGWLMKENFNTNPYQAQMFAMSKGQTQGQYVLGAMLSGRFPSYSGDGKSEETRMIVIGDADFASNILQYSDSMYNVNFAMNLAEWLTNDDDLLDIRTRSTRDMRLNKIKDPEAKRRAFFFAVIVNVVIIPLIVILFGVRRFSKRQKQKRIMEE